MEPNPLVSVIIPVHNGARYLAANLRAITRSTYERYEIIVVDDASTENLRPALQSFPVRLLILKRRSGPAAARNFGAAAASGAVLLFVDCDVLVRPDTLAGVVARLAREPRPAAVFGSYDDEPAATNWVSQYKNLVHHFVHQTSNPDAVTFWAGCGAIRREVFAELAGFDQKRYHLPSIEDIELGYRLIQKGYRIVLDRDLQVKHLKRWHFGSLLRTDIRRRAVPWAELMLTAGMPIDDLNLRTSQRISAGLVGIAALCTALSPAVPRLLYPVPLLLLAVCLINRQLCKFFIAKRGLPFAAAAMALQCLYYLYGGTAYVGVWLRCRLQRMTSGRARV